MTNQEIVAVQPFILALFVLLIFIISMIYQYRKIGKSISEFFKPVTATIALLVAIILGKNDNN
jgi:hypothetical protein